MRFFRSRGRQERVDGELGYFGLADWWLSTFSPEERAHIEDVFEPMGSGPRPLTQGQISSTSGTAVGLLWALAGWFPKDIGIAARILEKAEALADSADVLDRHFLYQQMVKTYYPHRSDVRFLEAAIRACEAQIALAPKARRAFLKEKYMSGEIPAHVGFRQLAIIREKQKDYAEAIRLARLAKKQGWAGDWDKRVERCEKKMHRG